MRDRIDSALRNAKAIGDDTRLPMLRLIKSTIADKDSLAAASGNQDQVPDDVIVSILNGMIERRKQSAVTYDEQGQFELADGERTEIQVLRELLPRQLGEEEILEAVKKAVRATKARGVRDKGRVMSYLKSNYAGQMDFRNVGRLVGDRLSSAAGRSGKS